MPNYDVLYYPSFEPSEIFLRRYLLFFDRISTIIPNEVHYIPESQIFQSYPDLFHGEPPNKEDVDLDDYNYQLLGKAFRRIRKLILTRPPKRNIIVVNSEGTFQFSDTSLMHNRKISEKVFYLLKKYKLIYPKPINGKDFYLVDERACNIILSLIADRMGTRKTWNTITNMPLDFTVSSLNTFQYQSLHKSRNFLIQSIVEDSNSLRN